MPYGYEEKIEPIRQNNIKAIGKSLVQNHKTLPRPWENMSNHQDHKSAKNI
jgi:hypothetical protein